MMNRMTMSDIPVQISSETKRLIIAIATDREEKQQLRREAVDEINRIKRLINEEEEKIARGKEEIKRIRGIKKAINDNLACVTNAIIAEKMDVPIKKVNHILSNRTSR